MIPALWLDGAEGQRVVAQSELRLLARALIDKVGFDGAARYCHGVGWHSVLEQAEELRRQQRLSD